MSDKPDIEMVKIRCDYCKCVEEVEPNQVPRYVYEMLCAKCGQGLMTRVPEAKIASNTNITNNTGKNNILIGQGIECEFDNCVLIGNGLVATRDNQVVIGNDEVRVRGEFTPEHHEQLMATLKEIVFRLTLKGGGE